MHQPQTDDYPGRLRIDRIADLSSEATTFGKSPFISWYFLKIALQPVFFMDNYCIIVANSVLVCSIIRFPK